MVATCAMLEATNQQHPFIHALTTFSMGNYYTPHLLESAMAEYEVYNKYAYLLLATGVVMTRNL